MQSSVIRVKSYARAGLAGNPSDGFYGKTLSFTFQNFFAEVTLFPSLHLELLAGPRDRPIYSTVNDMVKGIDDFGYYGGIRLLQAAIKKFIHYCGSNKITLKEKNFSIRYFTNIPTHVGMAGSSAIITACLKCLMKFYKVSIAKPALANLALSVESDELGIGAGLQDRVAQVYEGLTFMDFDIDLMESRGFGKYENLDTSLLKNIYLAYKSDLSEGSELFHNDFRSRFDSGDPEVLDAIKKWANIADEVRACLQNEAHLSIGHLLNANFDLRRSLCKIHPDNIAMVDAARSVGASAKFTGSGGAIVGQFDDQTMYEALVDTLQPLGITVLKPSLC
ncbi:GHMP kinase [bacterium]|nr:GHMP kinase [Akkermansiaceae bacterium]MDC0277196.1 GHMP kinase [bacterium]